MPRARWSSAIKKKKTGEEETVVLKKCFKCKKREDVTIVGISSLHQFFHSSLAKITPFNQNGLVIQKVLFI